MRATFDSQLAEVLVGRLDPRCRQRAHGPAGAWSSTRTRSERATGEEMERVIALLAERVETIDECVMPPVLSTTYGPYSRNPSMVPAIASQRS